MDGLKELVQEAMKDDGVYGREPSIASGAEARATDVPVSPQSANGTDPAVENVKSLDTSQPSTAPGPLSEARLIAYTVNDEDANVDMGNTATIHLDKRWPYRCGYPKLTAFPITTTSFGLPNVLLPGSKHRVAIQKVLEKTELVVEDVIVAHRGNPGALFSKTSLTLCVLCGEDDREDRKHWEEALGDLYWYLSNNDLSLTIELIDARMFKGPYTHRFLPSDTGSANKIRKNRHQVSEIVQASGEDFVSVHYYLRGGKKRADCRATVIIGVPEPNAAVWWETVKPQVEEVMGKKWAVEIVFAKPEKL